MKSLLKRAHTLPLTALLVLLFIFAGFDHVIYFGSHALNVRVATRSDRSDSANSAKNTTVVAETFAPAAVATRADREDAAPVTVASTKGDRLVVQTKVATKQEDQSHQKSDAPAVAKTKEVRHETKHTTVAALNGERLRKLGESIFGTETKQQDRKEPKAGTPVIVANRGPRPKVHRHTMDPVMVATNEVHHHEIPDAALTSRHTQNGLRKRLKPAQSGPEKRLTTVPAVARTQTAENAGFVCTQAALKRASDLVSQYVAGIDRTFDRSEIYYDHKVGRMVGGESGNGIFIAPNKLLVPHHFVRDARIEDGGWKLVKLTLPPGPHTRQRSVMRRVQFSHVWRNPHAKGNQRFVEQLYVLELKKPIEGVRIARMAPTLPKPGEQVVLPAFLDAAFRTGVGRVVVPIDTAPRAGMLLEITDRQHKDHQYVLPGMSGGPIGNCSGEIVSVVSQYVKTPTKPGMVNTIAVPVTDERTASTKRSSNTS